VSRYFLMVSFVSGTALLRYVLRSLIICITDTHRVIILHSTHHHWSHMVTNSWQTHHIAICLFAHWLGTQPRQAFIHTARLSHSLNTVIHCNQHVTIYTLTYHIISAKQVDTKANFFLNYRWTDKTHRRYNRDTPSKIQYVNSHTEIKVQ